MELFDSTLKYTNARKDKLAVFDGNILVGAQSNEDENGTKTMVTFRRVKKPEGTKIGDENNDFLDVEGYAFHFNRIESIDVVIKVLEEIKTSMKNAL